MPRTARVVIPGLPHHTILRANNGRRLFSYPYEYEHFLFLVGRALKHRRATVHALVLMTNHVHLIVSPSDSLALADFVKRVGQPYAQVRNKTRSQSGKLFDERFFSTPIVSERQLAITTAYVELNPVRAGMVEHPDQYRWSTYALHRGLKSRVPAGLWTPTDWYLGLSPDHGERAARYEAWLRECRERDLAPEQASEHELEEALRESAGGRRLRRPNGSSGR